ncbi:GRAM domain-containing protein [Dactylosporangium sp. AC04546]|uniref:GRAM domain-containing protein n=1 Tax=Dactylosporangium sp. AC04546 TaxID=2862460 RepID=UPI001EDEC845|nr:GRAM domain-containing protein [Dactylosporangium sp. AC04546]WVK81056.1 GRAM domain-containing protein [Dactylosporangium sp. AC04546]
MDNNEDVVLRVRANLWRGSEAVAGHLTLTETHLRFRAHGLNIQTQPLDVPVAEITSMRKYNNMRIIPNGLAVTMASGTEHRFVVGGRDRLIAAIEALQS